MGGKSRKTGGVSKRLIDRIKKDGGAPASSKNPSSSEKKKKKGADGFGLEDSMSS